MGKRYFIVCYCYTCSDKHGDGYVEIITDNYCFLNKRITIEEIGLNLNANSVIITNIIELSKEDYETWMK